MAKANENAVLVEIEHATGKVLRVVRSYLSERRAQEDLELLSEINRDTLYSIQTVEHIDD